jgi:DNA-binding CsgD family transcriptional regulator
MNKNAEGGLDKARLLTPRQEQILSLLTEGKSNKEIAEELGIQQGTVKQHLFVLFRRLGVVNRAKAVIAANQLLKSQRARGRDSGWAKPAKQSTIHHNGYVWRMISVVAVFLPDATSISTRLLVQRDEYLLSLRLTVSEFTEALDGQFVSMPYGGFLAWFGHPYSHLDDADRAVHLAQSIQKWSDHYCLSHFREHESELLLNPIGIGVASHPEVVAEKTVQITGAESFRSAAILARHARPLGRPLADESTRRLAPLSVPWFKDKVISNQSIGRQREGSVSVIGEYGEHLIDTRLHWEGVDVIEEIFTSVQRGTAQWVAVECWPPAAATALIDMIGNAASAKGFNVLRLRMPVQTRRDRVVADFVGQIEMVSVALNAPMNKIYPLASDGERLGSMLRDCASKPLVVQVYGLKALDALASVLGERGINKLVSCPILIVAANLMDTGQAQMVVRLLGLHPKSQLLSKVFSMQMIEHAALPQEIRTDLQSSLDGLSIISKQLIMAAATEPTQPIDYFMTQADLPHHQTQSCLFELTASGLIAPKSGGGFQIRDLMTAQAIHNLTVTIPELGES